MFKKFKKFLYTKDGVEQIEINKQLLITVVSVFFTVISVIGVSFAAFVWSDNSEKEHSIAVGNINLTISSNSEPLGSGLNYPVNDSDVDSLEPYTFKIINNGSLAANYTLKLVDDTAAINSDGCSSKQIDKNYIYAKINGSKTVSNISLTELMDISIDSGTLTPGQSKTYNLRLWIEQSAPNSVIGGHFHGKILLESSQVEGAEPLVPIFVDNSGANKPELVDGLIPVVYNSAKDVWVRADTEAGWYAYQDQIWANAVTTTSENRETYLSKEHIGKEIPMDEINGMWVWIPKYKYKISTGLGSTTALTNPPQIDVVFENNVTSTGKTESAYRAGLSGTSNATNSNYYTHPAFRDINSIVYSSETSSRGAWRHEDIAGFWAAKFEVGTTTTTCVDEATCTDVEPIIKPDVQSLRNQNVSTQFLTSLKFAGGTMNTSTGEVTFTTNINNIYGLNTKTNRTNTHMMKNTEWGAVAYLSQSKYGKMGNFDYNETNKEVYKNNSTSYYTGRSSGTPPASGSTANGTYSYNDMSCTTVEITALGNTCSGNKTNNAGTGASTTGNIYGIYDMSGGAHEYVMGNWANYSGSSLTYNSGFTGINKDNSSTTGISFPESQYYDLYKGTSSSSITREKSIMGDAMWETMRWYSDNTKFVYTSGAWFMRGGYYSNSTNAGIFHSNTYDGGADVKNSWRPVLIQTSGANSEIE